MLIHNSIHLHIIFIHIYDTNAAVNSIHLCSHINVFLKQVIFIHCRELLNEITIHKLNVMIFGQLSRGIWHN